MNFDVNKAANNREEIYIKLINEVEKMDVTSEIKVLSQNFKKFLKKNIFSIFDILLNSELNTAIFNIKCLNIITCRSQEVYKIINDEISIISLIVDFAKKESTKLQMSNYVQILSQLFLHSIYDFLGLIPNPHTFMVSLIEKEDFCMQTFLHEFLLDEMNERRLFFENAKVPQILLSNLNAKPYFSAIILMYISTLATRLTKNSPLLEEFVKPKSILYIVNLALTTNDHNSSAKAFDLIVFMYSNEFLPKESKDVISSELVRLCNFITMQLNQIFDASSRSCANLIMSIIKDMFKSKSSDDVESRSEYVPKFATTNLVTTYRSPFQSTVIPSIYSASRKSKFSKGSIQQNLKHIPVSERLPMIKKRTESSAFFYNPTREASAKFSLMSIVSSCPVFSLQKSGLLTIDEEEAKFNTLDNEYHRESLRKSSKAHMLDNIVNVVTYLIRNFFVYKFNTNLHNCVVEFLDTILDHTDIFPRVVMESNILNYIRDSKKNRGDCLACYWGQVNSIIGLFKKCDETNVLYEEFKEDYEEYYSIITKHVELTYVRTGLFPLLPD